MSDQARMQESDLVVGQIYPKMSLSESPFLYTGIRDDLGRGVEHEFVLVPPTEKLIQGEPIDFVCHMLTAGSVKFNDNRVPDVLESDFRTFTYRPNSEDHGRLRREMQKYGISPISTGILIAS